MLSNVGNPDYERLVQKKLNHYDKFCNFVNTLHKSRECDQIVWEYNPEKLYKTECTSQYFKFQNAYLSVPNGLQEYLKTCQNKYVVVRLTYVLKTSKIHSNMMIFDNQNMLMFRFEPYGHYIEESNKNRDRKLGYLLMINALKTVFKNYTYVSSEQTSLKYGIQYWQEQEISQDDLFQDFGQDNNKFGFCSIWAVWLVDVFLSFNGSLPDIKTFLQNFINSFKGLPLGLTDFIERRALL